MTIYPEVVASAALLADLPTTGGFVRRKSMSDWQKYRRTNVAEMRPVVKGEDFDGISVSGPDSMLQHSDPTAFDLGFVARNPKNHADQWYVARAYFDDNFEPVEG